MEFGLPDVDRSNAPAPGGEYPGKYELTCLASPHTAAEWQMICFGPTVRSAPAKVRARFYSLPQLGVDSVSLRRKRMLEVLRSKDPMMTANYSSEFRSCRVYPMSPNNVLQMGSVVRLATEEGMADMIFSFALPFFYLLAESDELLKYEINLDFVYGQPYEPIMLGRVVQTVRFRRLPGGPVTQVRRHASVESRDTLFGSLASLLADGSVEVERPGGYKSVFTLV